ncbi:MAG: hypothetical protein M3N14_02870 [Bacteroidota bacterium]|nr:hypothetical protein [Bacteroidota bacterium]
MRPKLLLRIAAVLMLLHTIGHTIGAFGSTAPPNARVGLVIRGMETEHFNFMGRTTTLAQFYNGYGIIMIFVLLLISIQLWLLASAVNKSLMLTMGVFLLITAVCEFVYFFPLAALFSLLSGVATLFAYYNVKVTS